MAGMLTMRDLAQHNYTALHSLSDLREVLREAHDFNGIMTRLNPAHWIPAVRVLASQQIPDMLIVAAISLGGLLLGFIAMYLVLRFCLGRATHPRLQMATHTRSNAVHVIALSLKILFIIAGLYTALSVIGIDPVSVALSVGVVGLMIGYAFQRPASQVAATFTLTGGGLLAEGMVVVVATRVGIVRGEITAIGTYNTLIQGTLIGGVAKNIGLKEDGQMVFYVPNSDFIDGSWGRMPSREDAITTTGEGQPNAPPTLPVPVGMGVSSDGSGVVTQLMRYVTGSGKASMLKRVSATSATLRKAQ